MCEPIQEDRELTSDPAVGSTGLFGDPTRRYSVVCAKGDHSERIVATGLPLMAARELCERLDQAYRDGVEATGRRYSTWTADLHYCQLETPNTEVSQQPPEIDHERSQ